MSLTLYSMDLSFLMGGWRMLCIKDGQFEAVLVHSFHIAILSIAGI